MFFSVLAGSLLALAYPPYNLEFLAWIALVPLLFALEGKSLSRSFFCGWLAGFVMFIFQIFWFRVFHVSIPFLVSAYLALYFGLFALLYSFVKNKIIAPFLWVAIEYIRTIGFWGFPAGLLGYSQYLNIPLIQISDLTGVFGVSFLIAAANLLIYSLLKEKRIITKTTFASALVFALIFAYGSLRKPFAMGEKVRIAAVQPNIANNGYDAMKVLDKLEALSHGAGRPDLIIWPETIIRENLRRSPDLSGRIFDIIKKTKAYLLLGSRDLKDNKHYNSAFLFAPDGRSLGQYNKLHPIPLWESYPLRFWLPFLNNVEEKGRCDAGNEFTVFNMGKAKFSSLICFEGIFPDLSRNFVKSGAQFLVNISNDMWSNSKAEHYQHASMSVFRAVENRIYYVRAGNSGVTKIIDPAGRIVKSLPIYTSAVLTCDIYPSLNKSFYSKYGDVFAYFCIIASIIMLWRRRDEKA